MGEFRRFFAYAVVIAGVKGSTLNFSRLEAFQQVNIRTE